LFKILRQFDTLHKDKRTSVLGSLGIQTLERAL
jgi:hypothetical protein